MTSKEADRAFIETKHYHRFREFCDACRKYQYIGLCYGPAGVGKTLSARHYADWDKIECYTSRGPGSGQTLADVQGSSVVFYTPPVVVSSPNKLPYDIGKLRGVLRGFLQESVRREAMPTLDAAQERLHELYPYCRDPQGQIVPADEIARRGQAWTEASKLMHDSIQAQPDPTSLILIDEADRLKMTGLEQMRDIFDGSGIGMVLIGMPGIEKKLARYPQLYSRIGFVHEFRPLSEADMRALLKEPGWMPTASLPKASLTDEKTVAAIIRITEGNFRLLHRLLAQIGRILEVNGMREITSEVVEAAREALVIGAA